MGKKCEELESYKVCYYTCLENSCNLANKNNKSSFKLTAVYLIFILFKLIYSQKWTFIFCLWVCVYKKQIFNCF